MKVLLAHRAPTTAVERFRREAHAAAKLHHTNIVPVFGVGEDEGQLYYVMQFIESESLDQVFNRLGRTVDDAGNAPPSSHQRRGQMHVAESNSSTLSTEGPTPSTSAPSLASAAMWPSPGLRPQAGHSPPRHQARQPAARCPGEVWVTDFGLAKAFEGEDRLTDRRHPRHRAYWPRSARWPLRAAERRLFAGRDLV